jgi:PEP-CTERM motif
MKRATLLTATLGTLMLTAALAPAQTVFTAWSFNNSQSAPYNNPAPGTGAGTALILGMDNSYNGGNTNYGDVTLTTGTANTSFSEYTWRIRGNPNNGWAATAPEYGQGIELDVSTLGYQDILFSFDWYCTAQGIRDLQFQYNLDAANSAGWVNFGGTSPTGTYIATAKDFYNAPGSPTISIDLRSITGANNDPNFGIRLVSAYDSTGNLGDEYASATLSSGATVEYNGTSGNWRFDNLDFTGTAVVVPEPSTLALAGLGLTGLIAVRRRNWKA